MYLSSLFCVLLGSVHSYRRAEESLVLAQVIVRHGDRTLEMDYTFPTINITKESLFPYGPGEINLEGKKQMVQVGRALRERYQDFLGDFYYHDLIEATSSEYKRTMMSMQAVLAGLFPPIKSMELEPGLHWQPITFNYIPFKNDKYLATYIPCPGIFDLKTFMNATTLDFYRYLTEHSGLKVTNSFGVSNIVQSVLSLVEFGYEMPDWINAIWPQPLQSYGADFWTDIMNQKLPTVTGSLIAKINEDFQMKINGTNGKKVVLYNGHDLNIAGMLGVTRLYDHQAIPYASYLIVELHQINEEFYVQLLLENYESDGPQLLTIPGCSKFCEFHKFLQITTRHYAADPWCS